MNTLIKKFVSLLCVFAVFCSLSGCSKPESEQSSTDVEVIVVEGDTVMDNESTVSLEQSVSSEQQPVSSVDTSVSSSVVSEEDDDVQDDWRTHPQDFKLLAFTFDGAPNNKTLDLVQLFEWYQGAGTFFAIGTYVEDDGGSYDKLQKAINSGWDIGHMGATHLVATNGQTERSNEITGKVSYEDLKHDIVGFTEQLEANLKKADGTPYDVSLYRPPNIKPTDVTFKICTEEDLIVIWKTHDTYDWVARIPERSNMKEYAYDWRYNHVKEGIGTWEDGDIILGHGWSDDTYKILYDLLPEFYRAGYRFCSITDIMKYRGISRSDISGELNNAEQNDGMVTNIIKSASFGKSK